MIIHSNIFEFDWDFGNIGKNKKYHVTDSESEEVFSDENKITFRDVLHSSNEVRFILIGQTKQERLLYVIFTLRSNKLRIISARDINKKERIIYEKNF
ncbi:MAG: BrnT family toxin [Elusimicrobia bacterium]|nr:BrnT family toxin [Elusimicrobiota bacterium]